DGGNRDVILHNTNILAAMRADIPILVAGNRSVLPEVEELLQSAGKNVSTCDNVLPELNVLNTEPVQQRIRNLFLERIVRAKGLSRVKELTRGIIMPTPSAVFLAVTLLAKGYDGEGGIGELLAVDVGGATTDIYSIAAGECQNDSFFWKGLPELYEKRTVEGDLGLRYSSKCLTEQAGMNNVAKLAGLDFSRASKMLSAINDNYALIPENKDLAAFDDSLAYYAVTLASNRHAGTIEWHYTINGRVMIQSGKDLSGVKKIIGTGGPVVHSTNPQGILQGLLADRDKPHVLKPLAADLY